VGVRETAFTVKAVFPAPQSFTEAVAVARRAKKASILSIYMTHGLSHDRYK
jgi:hypothetical protein